MTTQSSEVYTSGQYCVNYPTWHAEDSAWKARQVLRVFEPQKSAGPIRICDIGCGAGGVIASLEELLSAAGVDAQFVGYDIAGAAIERARQQWNGRARLAFQCQDVLELEKLDYNVCLLMDVLEHLEDPKGFLRKLHDRGLRDFVIHLPLENNWSGIMRGKTDPRCNKAGHLHFLDTHSALSLLERSGLTVVKWVYTPELDLDIRHHRTPLNMLAYVPRKLFMKIAPALTVHTIGGAALMARCTFAQ